MPGCRCTVQSSLWSDGLEAKGLAQCTEAVWSYTLWKNDTKIIAVRWKSCMFVFHCFVLPSSYTETEAESYFEVKMLSAFAPDDLMHLCYLHGFVK